MRIAKLHQPRYSHCTITGTVPLNATDYINMRSRVTTLLVVSNGVYDCTPSTYSNTDLALSPTPLEGDTLRILPASASHPFTLPRRQYHPITTIHASIRSSFHHTPTLIHCHRSDKTLHSQLHTTHYTHTHIHSTPTTSSLAFVGKQRFENDRITVPPGRSTRCISLATSSGCVR